MSRISILVVLVFTTIAAHADLVMELNLFSPKLKAVVKIKDDKVRYDILPDGGYGNTSRIADLKTGDDFTLDHVSKRIIKNPSILSNQTNTAGKVIWPKFQDTGKTETVGGYEAEIYDRTNSNGGIESLWVAKSFPDFKKIKHDLVKLDRLDIGNWMPEFNSLSGMPLKLALSVNGPNGMVAMPLTLISAKEESIDASTYDASTNFHNWYGPIPDGDFFRALREVPNYSLNLDFINPTNNTGIPADGLALQGTVTTRIKLPDRKIINEDFHIVYIDQDADGIYKIRADSLGWLKPDKAFSRLQRELHNWTSDVFSPEKNQETEAEVQHWLTTWPAWKDQYKGFSVKRPGYILNFSFIGGMEDDGYAYCYELTFREKNRTVNPPLSR